MPELKRNFTSGRMNKDLDERLVPNGEYRDALNITVSTSTGSNVGSIQSVKGSTSVSNINWGSSTRCIGSVRDEKTNKIYWFIHVDGNNFSADGIVEYDVNTDKTNPVLIDRNNILNFSNDNLITGANILDGILFFTDGLNEPKQVDIVKCKNGSVDFTTHTKLIVKGKDEGNILKEHITVIKKSPLNAPNVTLSNSMRDGIVNTTFQSSLNFFVDTSDGSNPVSLAPGSPIATGNNVTGNNTTNMTFSPKPNYNVSDVLKFSHKSTVETEEQEYEVRVLLTELVPTSNDDTSKTFKAKILSITNDVIGTANIVWDVTLEQKDPFFELAFPRFAYRWKYSNGQYSAFSPFSEVAFLPDEVNGFEYDTKDGHNLAMTNNIRKITLNTFDTKPKDVTELDILYKQSNNTNVYTVKSLKNNETSFEITSEQIHASLPSNQILRPYDNVPRKAKAQEIVANRLAFGNYTENYNIIEDPKFEVGVVSNNIANEQPSKSLKSIRKYQLGVVYLDEFGRQTPVFSDDTAVVSIDQIQSNKINKIQAKITTPAPSWATHFKYYIKEISNEYYNLAMDRYYEAEDGNVWLSFPSSERNKVDDETYLILKKKHTENTSVYNTSGGTVKYKILDISNSAPTFLKQKKFSLGVTSDADLFDVDSAGFPTEGFLSFKVKGSKIGVFKDINTSSVADKYIRISSSNNTSNYYRLSSVEVTDAGTTGVLTEAADTWKFNLVSAFGKDIDFVGTNSDKTQNLTLEIFQEEIDENNPEFVGRFFVKIPRDSILDDNILSRAVNKNYVIKNAQNIFEINTSINTKEEYAGTQLYAIDRATGFNVDNSSLTGGKGAKKGSKNIDIRLIEIGPDGDTGTLYPNRVNLTANADLDAQLRTNGTLLRFKSDIDQEVYKIVSTSVTRVYNWGKGPIQKKKSSNHGLRYSITLDKELNFSPQDSTTVGETAASGTPTVLEVVKELVNEETFSSDSPAIFETEPKPAVDLDLYYETSNTYLIQDLAVEKILTYFNCFSFGNGVESNRIRDDYNAPLIDKGVRVSTVLAEQYKEENKASSIIYSGIYNSTSGINRLNQFIQAEKITKDLNPEYGSIQKLHTRNTDLIALCEDKVLKILANKDALFNADGNINLTSTNNVLGQAVPFAGEYGISKNPESFASYGYRAYFSDKDRGAVLRLSIDGLTKISDYGMSNYFSDKMLVANTMIGSYDEDNGNYNITFIEDFTSDIRSTIDDTVSFAESINGWESRKSFIPESGLSLNNIYYTFNKENIQKHSDNVNRSTFAGASSSGSRVTLLLNDAPSSIKNFKTLNYEGTTAQKDYNTEDSEYDTDGWYVYSIETDQQSGEIKTFKEKEGKWFNYIKGTATTTTNLDPKEFPVQGIGTLSSITDATGQSLYKLIININGLSAQNLKLYPNIVVSNNIASSVGNDAVDVDNNRITITGVGNIPSGETIAIYFSVTDSSNYVLPASQSFNSLPSDFTSQAHTGGTDFAYITLTTASQTLTSDKTITLTLANAAVEKTYSINGTFDTDVANNTVASASGVSYSGSAIVNGKASNIIDRTFTASSNHYFAEPPQMIFTDVKHEDNYEVVITDTPTDGVANNNLTARRFQVSYNITEKQNVSGDKINFIARAVNNQTSTNKLYNFTCDQTAIDYYGAERDVRVYGDVGATYKISVSDGSNTYDFSSDTFTSSSTESGTLTIPATGFLDTTIVVPSATAATTYTFTLTPVGSSAWNDGDSTKAFTISQTKKINVTFQVTQANQVGGSSSVTPQTYVVKGQSGSTELNLTGLSYVISSNNNINLVSTPSFNSWTNNSVDISTKELTLANGTKVKILQHLVDIDNTTSPKTATYSARAFVTEFGTADVSTLLDISNHLSASASNSYVYLGVTENDDDLTSVSLTSGNVIADAATTASGTGKVVGDFSGNLISDITINVVSITDTTQITAFGLNASSVTPQSVTPTSLTQISSTVWEATFDWSATLDAQHTSTNTTYNVQLSVDLGGIQ